MGWRTDPHGVSLLSLPPLDGRPGFGHFFSGRHGGVSAPPFAELNLALHVGDDPAAVRANRARLARAAGLAPHQLVVADQVHGARVSEVTAAMIASGGDAVAPIPATDALVTAVPGLCLMVQVADCVPVLLLDPAGPCVGAVHAGWRGTAQDVAGATVRAMGRAFGSDPARIVAAIGPSIGPGDYEVGAEVVAAIQAAFPGAWGELLTPTRPGHAHLDLWAAVQRQLAAAGLRPEHIHLAGLSTARATADFYSVRGEGNPTGRFAGGVWVVAPASPGATTSRSSAPSP